MTPQEIEILKEEMRKIFLEEVRKIDFRKIFEGIKIPLDKEELRKFLKDEGTYWG